MSDSTASDTPPRPRRRRVLRWVLISLVAFPLLVVLGLVIARQIFDDERLRQLIEKQGTAILGAPVRLGGLKLALFHEITLENFVVGPPEGFTKDVLRIDFAHVPDHQAARERLKDLIRAGDAVLVKGSNSVGLSHLVTALTNGDLGLGPLTSANEV